MNTFSKYILLTTALLFVGFGCKGVSDTQRAAVSLKTIDYWTVYEDVDLLRQFAAEYRQFRPYVTINIRRVREDQFDDLFVNALADDVAPDIISVPIRELPKYQPRLDGMPRSVNVADVYVRQTGLSDETVIEPVTNAMPSTSNIRRTYIKAVEENAIIGSTVYGLPLAVDTLAVYVNRDILDRSGVPELPESWNEFTDAVKATTKFDANGNIIQSGVALGTVANNQNAFDILSVLFMQNGLSIGSRGVNALADGVSRSDENHPTFETLRFFTDFARSERDVYSWNNSFSTARDEFIRGRSAFYIGYAYERSDIDARAPQIEYDIIPLPQLDPTNPKQVINFSIQSVVEKSNSKNESWDFIRFMSLPQNIERYVGASELPTPLRSQVVPQSELQDMAPFMQGLLTAENWYQGRNFDTVNNAFNVLVTSFVAPYSEDQTSKERDIAILDRFIRTIEQTR